DDREPHVAAMAVLFRHRTPGVLGLAAGGERSLDLRRAGLELVEVERPELATDNPIVRTVHRSLLLLVTADRLLGRLGSELRRLGGVVQRRGGRRTAGDRGRNNVEVAGADLTLMARRRIAVLLRSEFGLL